MVVDIGDTSVVGSTVCSQGKEHCGRRSGVKSHLVNVISETYSTDSERLQCYPRSLLARAVQMLGWAQTPTGAGPGALLSLPGRVASSRCCCCRCQLGPLHGAGSLPRSQLICVPCGSCRVPPGLSPALSIFNPHGSPSCWSGAVCVWLRAVQKSPSFYRGTSSEARQRTPQGGALGQKLQLRSGASLCFGRGWGSTEILLSLRGSLLSPSPTLSKTE